MRSLIPWRLTIVLAVLLLPATRQVCAFEEPYCGLYSLYAALHSIGVHAEDFNDMSVPEYLSGTQGSTALDLVQLAEKYGATGTFRTGMTVATLRAATSPIILHTSIAVSEAGFHHWILFLGADGNDIKVYDPPRGMYTVTSAELLSFWDGSGVVVQQRENQAIRRAWNMIPAVNLELIVAFLLVLVVGGVVARTTVLIRHPLCGIVLVAFVSSMVWHATIDYGFLWNRNALANVASRFDQETIPIVTTDQFRELARRQDVMIVDTRRPNSYKRSHVPGAINIPVTITHGALRDTLAAIPVDKHIVTYCQSERCGWSDAIAHQFTARGYRHVSVFRDGMNAWESITTDTR